MITQPSQGAAEELTRGAGVCCTVFCPPLFHMKRRLEKNNKNAPGSGWDFGRFGASADVEWDGFVRRGLREPMPGDPEGLP